MLDEVKCRRPDWIEGTPIRLYDPETGHRGQEWHLPKMTRELRIRLRVPISDALTVGLAPVESNTRFGPTFWALHETLLTAIHKPQGGTDEEQADDEVAKCQAVAEVCWNLLRRNYTLTDDQLTEMLPLVVGNEENKDVWGEIVDHALGIAPKPTAVG